MQTVIQIRKAEEMGTVAGTLGHIVKKEMVFFFPSQWIAASECHSILLLGKTILLKAGAFSTFKVMSKRRMELA